MCLPHSSEKICYIIEQCVANKLIKVLDQVWNHRGHHRRWGLREKSIIETLKDLLDK